MSDSKILVAYFSAQGATRRAARAVARAVGGDLFEIRPKVPYAPSDLDWTKPRCRVCREHEQGGPELDLEENAPANFSEYQTVFLGFPIWWYTAAWPVDRFASANDFSGKKVIVFCTSGGSPLGDSRGRLAGLAGSGQRVDGAQFSSGSPESSIAAFARNAL